MTKQLLLSCREVGCYDYCDYIVTGDTKAEIVRNAVIHNMKAHGRTKKDMTRLREKLSGFIYTVHY